MLNSIKNTKILSTKNFNFWKVYKENYNVNDSMTK